MACYARALPGQKKACVNVYRHIFRNKCVNETAFTEKQCDEIADNGEYTFCSHLPDWEGCKGSNKKLVLPTTTTTTTTTTETPRTTESPFPIGYTIGGAAGGFLVAIILGLIIWLFKKKKNAKKGGNYGGTTGTTTGIGTTKASGFSTATGTRKTGIV